MVAKANGLPVDRISEGRRSARTVDHHLAAIFAKLGVAIRAEAVSAAYRLNFISDKPLG